eukprot:3318654-Prymnesium_polylepis.1
MWSPCASVERLFASRKLKAPVFPLRVSCYEWLTLIFTRLSWRACSALWAVVIGTGEDCGDRMASTTRPRRSRSCRDLVRRLAVSVTPSLVKTMGVPPWAIMPYSIATGAAVGFSHE